LCLFSVGSYIFLRQIPGPPVKIPAGREFFRAARIFRGHAKKKVGALFLALVPCLAALQFLPSCLVILLFLLRPKQKIMTPVIFRVLDGPSSGGEVGKWQATTCNWRPHAGLYQALILSAKLATRCLFNIRPVISHVIVFGIAVTRLYDLLYVFIC
jgi:hypothetical protein